MAYTSGLLKDRITILNRTEAQDTRWGKDGSGIGWQPAATVWASVDWARGKQAMNAGALDVYGTVIVRMRWNTHVNERSRIQHQGRTYQVLGDTFHADRQANTIQLHAQLVVNDGQVIVRHSGQCDIDSSGGVG